MTNPRVHPRAFTAGLAALCMAGLLPPAAAAAPAAETAAPEEAPPPDGPGSRVDEFAGWFHDAGNLWLHVSTQGVFGSRGTDITAPSAEWPGGSDNEHLYASGLWFGGVAGSDTLVSCGLFQREYRNMESDEGCGNPPEGICASFEGAPSSLRRYDDDGDGEVDEDALNGADDDGDGRIDEDYAAISNQYFRTTYYDTSTFLNQFYSDPANWNVPLGLEVAQETYQWTGPEYDDFVGVSLRFENVSPVLDGTGWTIEDAYFGLFSDADIGRGPNPFLDDHAAFVEVDTTVTPPGGGAPTSVHLEMAYMFDEWGSPDDIPSFLGVLFLGHSAEPGPGAVPESPPAVSPSRTLAIHGFRVWASGDADPIDDVGRYRYLRGPSDNSPHIDPPTIRSDDYRFLVSAGPVDSIPPGAAVRLELAFVAGLMEEVPLPGGGTALRPDLTNPIQAQRVYDGFVHEGSGEVIHWAVNVPPPPPNFAATPGWNRVAVAWDDFPESVADPVSGEFDFAGYQVWKADGWTSGDPPTDDMWRLVADFDTTELAAIDTGQPGVGKYRFVDTRVQNGFFYWYAVTAYDRQFASTPPGDAPVLVSLRPEVAPAPEPRPTPNPWRASSAAEEAVRFLDLPADAVVSIFTVDGRRVTTLRAEPSAPGRGAVRWNLRRESGAPVGSGVYLYHVETPTAGATPVTRGKVVVVR